MAGAYAILGLIFCIRLVVQSDVRPLVPAIGYSVGYAVVWPLLGIHWLAGLFSAVVSFGLTYVYLNGLELLGGWKYWAWLPMGMLVLGLTAFTAKVLCGAFGIEVE